jgi:hypothetical protein
MEAYFSLHGEICFVVYKDLMAFLVSNLHHATLLLGVELVWANGE